MADSHCPLCFTELITKNVTPYMECGGDEMELDHYQKHQYREYKLSFEQRLVLCDFCDVDFGSFDPTYFGFPTGQKVGLEHFNFVRDVRDNSLRKDKYCPSCQYRLSFLKFMSLAFLLIAVLF